MSTAICLLSGGLDSSTVLALSKKTCDQVYALSFDYGQRHRFELSCAKRIARAASAAHTTILIPDFPQIKGSSALTDRDVEVPKSRVASGMAYDIPITYVPARNTIFLSFALAWAELLGADNIFIGVNAVDYSGYPDCRPEFIEAYQRMANLATRAGVEGRQKLVIHTPLINMSKADIIRKGLELGVDYSLTSSCYDPAPGGAACGQCDSCQIRLKGFAEVGVRDPIRYWKVV